MNGVHRRPFAGQSWFDSNREVSKEDSLLTHRVSSKGAHSSQKLSKETPSTAKTARALTVFPLRGKGTYSNLIGKSLSDGGEPVQFRWIPSGICTLVPQACIFYGKRRRQPQIFNILSRYNKTAPRHFQKLDPDTAASTASLLGTGEG